MDIRMQNGCVLSTENKEVIDSYINKMGGVEVTSKQERKTRKSATNVSSALDAE